MKIMQLARFTMMAFALLALASGNVLAKDQLPSWNDGTAKTAILEFVEAVTDQNGPDYVEPAERIATFDNDGTLWLEYPIDIDIIQMRRDLSLKYTQ